MRLSYHTPDLPARQEWPLIYLQKWRFPVRPLVQPPGPRLRASQYSPPLQEEVASNPFKKPKTMVEQELQSSDASAKARVQRGLIRASRTGIGGGSSYSTEEQIAIATQKGQTQRKKVPPK